MTSTPTAPVAPDRSRRGRVALLGQFIRQPFVIGAVAPSSVHLARKMVEGVDLAGAHAVLEYGPGTGVFTDEILPRLGPSTRYLAIELNPAMAEQFRARHPGTPIRQDSVEHAPRICREEGIGPVDFILSGLPWASFPDDLQNRILDGALEVLRPGGQLITFGYQIGTWLKAGKRFYAELPRRFSRVERSDMVWRNLPPAFVVRCTK